MYTVFRLLGAAATEVKQNSTGSKEALTLGQDFLASQHRHTRTGGRQVLGVSASTL